jgi:hypothetical protein
MKFTKSELNQLLSYVENRERTNWYYGIYNHFEKRHLSIKEKILLEINKLKINN